MKQRLKRVALRIRGLLSFATEPPLKARIEQLERDLDEQRRNGLRVAEMLDLLETKLSPSTCPGCDLRNDSANDTDNSPNEH